MEKEAVFRVWSSDEGPPSHSVPPHQVAKAAARISADAFEKMHERLLTAYFTDNRDISDFTVLKTLWEEIELPIDTFENYADEEILKAIMTEHNQALQNGVSGVPAIMLEGIPGALVGAQEEAVYRRIIQTRLKG